jgi:hypothetical protein
VLTGDRLTHLLGFPPPCEYVAFAIFIAFALVALGHAVLRLLRDIDDFRSNRPR